MGQIVTDVVAIKTLKGKIQTELGLLWPYPIFHCACWTLQEVLTSHIMQSYM